MAADKKSTVGRVGGEKQPKKRKYKSKAKLSAEERSAQNKINGAKGAFKKNDPITGEKDPRIKRTGSPKTREELSKLALQLLHEVVKDAEGQPILAPDGQEMTSVEAILRRKIANPDKDDDVIDLAYGKPPKEVKVTGEIKLTPVKKVGFDMDKV